MIDHTYLLLFAVVPPHTPLGSVHYLHAAAVAVVAVDLAETRYHTPADSHQHIADPAVLDHTAADHAAAVGYIPADSAVADPPVSPSHNHHSWACQPYVVVPRHLQRLLYSLQTIVLHC